MHPHIPALQAKAQASTAVFVDTAPVGSVHHAILGVLTTVHGHSIIALHSEARLLAAVILGSKFATDVHHAVLGVLPALSGHLAALQSEALPPPAVTMGTANTVNVHHPVLVVLPAIHGHLLALHTTYRSSHTGRNEEVDKSIHTSRAVSPAQDCCLCFVCTSREGHLLPIRVTSNKRPRSHNPRNRPRCLYGRSKHISCKTR